MAQGNRGVSAPWMPQENRGVSAFWPFFRRGIFVNFLYHVANILRMQNMYSCIIKQYTRHHLTQIRLYQVIILTSNMQMKFALTPLFLWDRTYPPVLPRCTYLPVPLRLHLPPCSSEIALTPLFLWDHNMHLPPCSPKIILFCEWKPNNLPIGLAIEMLCCLWSMLS